MALAETRASDNLKTARMRLDVVRDNHVGAGSPSFRDLPFEFSRQPNVIIVKERDPLARRHRNPKIASTWQTALLEREITCAMAVGESMAGFPHIEALTIGDDNDFVIGECLGLYAGERYGEQFRAIVGGNDD